MRVAYLSNNVRSIRLHLIKYLYTNALDKTTPVPSVDNSLNVDGGK